MTSAHRATRLKASGGHGTEQQMVLQVLHSLIPEGITANRGPFLKKTASSLKHCVGQRVESGKFNFHFYHTPWKSLRTALRTGFMFFPLICCYLNLGLWSGMMLMTLCFKRSKRRFSNYAILIAKKLSEDFLSTWRKTTHKFTSIFQGKRAFY